MRLKHRCCRWIAVPLTLLLSVVARGADLRSDFDGSGSVDFKDFVLFARAFGTDDVRYDLDADGAVDFDDFVLFASDFVMQTPDDRGHTPAWTAIGPEESRPLERYNHTMILDPVRGRLVLFGGNSGRALGDTWIYELADEDWREIRDGSSPDPRWGHTAIYDGVRRRMVIFGGQSSGFFNDVWAFDLDGETWSQLAVSGDLPVPRYGLSAVIDSVRNRMIISHGFSAQGRFDDTWAFDLADHHWTDLTPTTGPKPLKRCLHDAVHDLANDRMLLFGGCSSGFGPCPQGDLWAFDLTRHEWREIEPSGRVPDARRNPALLYDRDGKRVLLFGGKLFLASNDLWGFGGGDETWNELTVEGTVPVARWSHDAAIDAANAWIYVFGGTDGSVRFNDLWQLEY